MGDIGIVSDCARSLSVETVTECRIFKVPFHGLRRHLAEHPADWACLYLLAVRRGRMVAEIVGELLTLSPKARLARLLLRLSQDSPAVEATQEDLARLAGMSRATFRRALGGLIVSGAVETRYGELRIADFDALRRRADGERDA